MATWDKDTIFIQLVAPTTGEDDASEHTVKVCPIDNTFPSGAITCTQCSTQKSRYFPSSDLDDETHYGVFVDDTRIGAIFAKKSAPAIGV